MSFDSTNTEVGITRPFAQSTNRGIGTALLVVSAVSLVWTLYSGIKKWQFVETAIVTVGTVDIINPLIISFETYTGESFKINYEGWRSKKFPSQVGQTVAIAYSKFRPTDVEIVDYFWTGQWIGGVWSLIVFAWGYALRKGYAVAGPLVQKRIRIGL